MPHETQDDRPVGGPHATSEDPRVVEEGDPEEAVDRGPVPDLGPLGLPAAEAALLRLLLHEGAVSTREAASRLGLSLSHVSNASGALKDRGFAVAGLSRSHGLLLAPLDEALDALLEQRRAGAEVELRRLERLRTQLLAVARWWPGAETPHTLVPRDLRESERKEALREVRDSLDLVVDRHHVNSHVPGDLIRVTRRWSRPTVRLLVTGTDDPRPLVVTGTLTDAQVAAAGIAVKRLPERSAAFAVYDDRRIEVPLWRLAASGWSDEPARCGRPCGCSPSCGGTQRRGSAAAPPAAGRGSRSSRAWSGRRQCRQRVAS